MSKQRMLALQQVVKGSGFLFLGHCMSFLIAFLYQVFIARYLGPANYGLVSLGIVIMSVGAVFVRLGLPQGINRFVAYYSAKKDMRRVKGTIISGLTIALIASAVVILVSLSISGFLAEKIFHSSEAVGIVRIFSVAIPFAALINIFYEILLGFKKPIHAVVIEAVFHKLLRLVVTVAFLVIGATVFEISLVYLIGLVITTVLAFFLLRRVFPVTSSSINGIPNYGQLISFSLPLFFAQFLGLVFGWGDSLMIGYFLDPTAVGIYRIAHSLSVFLSVFLMSFGSIFYPMMTEFLAKKKHNMIKTTYVAVSRLVFLITLPLFLIFVFFSSQIINIFFGRDYVLGSLSLIILSAGVLVSIFFGPAAHAIQTFGNTRFLFKVQFFNLLLNLGLNVLLIPVLGIEGAALTTAFTMSLVAFLCWLKVRGEVKVSFDIAKYSKYIFSGVVALGAVYLLTLFVPASNILLLAVAATLFMMFYFTILLLLKAFDRDDLMLIRAIEEKFGFKGHWISRMIRI